MANHTIKNPRVFTPEIRRFEVTDKGHANTFNAVTEPLINNDVFLKEKADDLEKKANELTENLETKVDKEAGKGLSSNDFEDSEKEKLKSIAEGANKYTHPSGDGNKHVPATGTGNNGKVLKAGATAGTMAWSSLTKSDVGLGNADNTKDVDKPISKATQNALNQKANTSHQHGNSDITGVDAGKITSGIIDIARLPAAAVERCVIVANDTARFQLTATSVQTGDTVKVRATDKMYFVVDATKLNTEAGYEVYTAGAAATVPWSGVLDKPDNYPPATHTHDDRYYTETEMAEKFKLKVDKEEGKGLSTNDYTNLDADKVQTQTFGSRATGSPNGKNSFVIGEACGATGENSVAIGNNAGAMGKNSVAIGQGASASGENSFAAGTSQATALYSFSIGNQNKATKQSAYAEGDTNTASGSASHAEGLGNTASGDRAHVEGQYTMATNLCAHAEGISTRAVSAYSHAEGKASRTGVVEYTNLVAFSSASGEVGDDFIEYTGCTFSPRISVEEGMDIHGSIAYADGLYAAVKITLQSTSQSASVIMYVYKAQNKLESGKTYKIYHGMYNTETAQPYTSEGEHAEGKNTTASGSAAHAEGCGTGSLGWGTHAEGVQTLAIGNGAHAEGRKCIACEYHAHAEGYNTKATGLAAHSEGNNTIASGIQSHAQGASTEASGMYSHAEGQYTIASNNCSHSEGQYIIASGRYSHAEGFGSVSGTYGARGFACHSEGCKTIAGLATATAENANGSCAHAEGYYAEATGRAAHAEGGNTKATGLAAHSEGNNTIASGQAAHAEGYMSEATADYAHAEGSYTTASGNFTHAEGYKTTASTYYAHAEGSYTTASGSASHAEGHYTTALANQHAQGHWNDTTTAVAATNNGTGTGTLFVIGNGSSSSKSNAMRINANGQIYAKMATISTGADYAEYFEWMDGNPNQEDRVGLFVTMQGEKIRIASKGDYLLGIVSGNPSVIGNGDECWQGRYVMDEFNRFIVEEFQEEQSHPVSCIQNIEQLLQQQEITVQSKKELQKLIEQYYSDSEDTTKEPILPDAVSYTIGGTKYKENPNYNPEKKYIQREERPEWAAIGMLGVLSVYDDGTCQVNGYCTCGEGGVATACEAGFDAYRVIARIASTIVKVVFR